MMKFKGSEWFLVAQLLRPQGRRGELLAELETDLALLSEHQDVWLTQDSDSDTPDPAPRVLESFWHPSGRNAGRIVMKLQGVETISEAETFAGRKVFLRTADLPPLEEGAYFTRDLIGCTLLTGDQEVGIVEDVQFPVGPDGRTRLVDAPDLLAVTTPGDTETHLLVPFVKDWLIFVDLDAKQIRLQLPSGLLDLAKVENAEADATPFADAPE